MPLLVTRGRHKPQIVRQWLGLGQSWCTWKPWPSLFQLELCVVKYNVKVNKWRMRRTDHGGSWTPLNLKSMEIKEKWRSHKSGVRFWCPSLDVSLLIEASEWDDFCVKHHMDYTTAKPKDDSKSVCFVMVGQLCMLLPLLYCSSSGQRDYSDFSWKLWTDVNELMNVCDDHA